MNQKKELFEITYQQLLKGLNLVQQKSWNKPELRHYFPGQHTHWKSLLDSRHSPQRIEPSRWGQLESLFNLLSDWEDPLEAIILERRLKKISDYFLEVEKEWCDENSLSFFLQDLPLMEPCLPMPLSQTQSAQMPGLNIDAKEARTWLNQELRQLFPQHEVSAFLSRGTLARISTSKRGLRLREDACFRRSELAMLVAHEAWVHLGTNLAGSLQNEYPWLGHWHPGVTGFQEGLALIAEICTGHWDQPREQQIILRHQAALKALDGENARQVWIFLCDYGLDKITALENTLRVFRGCSLDGGMCFAKEFQYLLGLNEWLQKRNQLQPIDMYIALSGKMDFYEWDMLRGTRLQLALHLPLPPTPLLNWMYRPDWISLQQRLGLKKRDSNHQAEQVQVEKETRSA